MNQTEQTSAAAQPELEKKPPAHEVILGYLTEKVDSLNRLLATRDAQARAVGGPMHANDIAVLCYVLAAMHVPEGERENVVDRLRQIHVHLAHDYGSTGEAVRRTVNAVVPNSLP